MKILYFFYFFVDEIFLSFFYFYIQGASKKVCSFTDVQTLLRMRSVIICDFYFLKQEKLKFIKKT